MFSRLRPRFAAILPRHKIIATALTAGALGACQFNRSKSRSFAQGWTFPDVLVKGYPQFGELGYKEVQLTKPTYSGSSASWAEEKQREEDWKRFTAKGCDSSKWVSQQARLKFEQNVVDYPRESDVLTFVELQYVMRQQWYRPDFDGNLTDSFKRHNAFEFYFLLTKYGIGSLLGSPEVKVGPRAYFENDRRKYRGPIPKPTPKQVLAKAPVNWNALGTAIKRDAWRVCDRGVVGYSPYSDECSKKIAAQEISLVKLLASRYNGHHLPELNNVAAFTPVQSADFETLHFPEQSYHNSPHTDDNRGKKATAIAKLVLDVMPKSESK